MDFVLLFLLHTITAFPPLSFTAYRCAKESSEEARGNARPREGGREPRAPLRVVVVYGNG